MKHPKYLMIADQIERDILQHKYNLQLPHAIELAQIYQTSKVTIARAVSYLQYKGIVKPVRGHGTFILAAEEIEIARHDNAQQLSGFTSRMNNTQQLTSNIISFTTRLPTEKEMLALKLKEIDLVYDIIRQRLLNGFPMRLEYTIMPVMLIPNLNHEILQKSIYRYISQDLDLKIGKSNRIFRADKADAYDQCYLECGHGDPVFEVEQIVFLENGLPFEYSQTRNRYDKGELVLNQV